MSRKILHLDLDAFFCAVEELETPSLKGKAFAVGGRPEQRGVVSSCSYPARKMGIHSAMPMARALSLSPRLIVLPPRHHLYSKYSSEVMEHLQHFAPVIEQISIDEAFMDLSDKSGELDTLARQIQSTIHKELNLPCSLGGATNKLVAKIATDVGKAAARSENPPNAITIVPAGQEADFLAPLPVQALWGVGPKTAERLAALEIRTIADLANYPEKELVRNFGKPGHDLFQHARGIDERPLVTSHETKSISQEITFSRDINDSEQLQQTIHKLAARVCKRLREEKLFCATVKLKLRWPDFTTITRQATLPSPTDQEKQILALALYLFNVTWLPGKAVRLIGIGVSNLQPPIRQLELWGDEPLDLEKEHLLQKALDELNQRFGDLTIRHASDLKPPDS
jgi:DNA polymerase-4